MGQLGQVGEGRIRTHIGKTKGEWDENLKEYIKTLLCPPLSNNVRGREKTDKG